MEKGDLMVVALPKGAVRLRPSQQESRGAHAGVDADEARRDELTVRQALITAFLRAGFRVKDAGLIESGRLSMHRYPATELERSRTVERSEMQAAGFMEKTTELQGSREGWWANPGLTVKLEDPTSLWAPELLRYRDLKARYFLRVFMAESMLIRGDETPTEVTESQYAEYVAATERWNQSLGDQKRLVGEHNDAVDQHAAQVNRYHAEYSTYSSRWQAYRDQIKQYNAVRATGLTTVPLERARDVERADKAREPSPLKILSREELSRRGLSSDIELRALRIAAELIRSDTGEVVWSGVVLSAGDLSNGDLIERAVHRMTRAK